MAIRAIDPRENSRQLTEVQTTAVRLENLEQRLDEFTTSFDMRLRRQKDELISEFKRLMQEQMEAIMSKLAVAEDLDFSVERTSSQAAVIDEMTELNVRSMSSNITHTLVPKTHDSLCPVSNEVRSGVFEEILPTGGRLSEIINQTNEIVKYLSGIKLSKNVVADPDIKNAVRDANMLVYVTPHQLMEGNCRRIKDVDELRDIPTIDTGDKNSSINRPIESLGEGKLRSKILAKLSPYVVVEKGMAKDQLNDLIKQPERPIPPPEPPPPYSSTQTLHFCQNPCDILRMQDDEVGDGLDSPIRSWTLFAYCGFAS